MRTTIFTSIFTAAALCTSAYAIDNPFVGTETTTDRLVIDAGTTQAFGNTETGETADYTINYTGITGAWESLVNSGKIIVNAGSTLTVNNLAKDSWKTMSYSGNMDIYGTVNTSYGASTTNSYCLVVGSGKILNVYDGGKLIFNSGAARVQWGRLNIAAGGKVQVDRLVVDGGNFIIGASDGLNSSDGQYNTKIVWASKATCKLNVSTTNGAEVYFFVKNLESSVLYKICTNLLCCHFY